MPLPVENLTESSPADAVRQAISESIRKCMEEGGRSQEECAGMVYEVARQSGAKIPGDRGGD